MISALRKFAAVRKDEQGSVVIETAFVLPVLLLLGLGGFEVSRLVSRNNELQIAVAEAGAIVLASLPEDQSDIDLVEDIIETSTGLEDSKVALAKKYRCDQNETLVDDEQDCLDVNPAAVISEFIEISITDWYTPIWTDFGIGEQVDYNFTRRVQIS